MKNTPVSTITLTMCLSAILLLFASPASGLPVEPLAPGSTVQLKLKDTAGNTWNLSQLKNKKAAVVAFWSPQAARSVDQLKTLSKIVATRTNVVVLAVTRGADSKERDKAVKTFKKERLNLPIVYDSDSRMAKEVFGVREVPAFFIFNNVGQLMTQELSDVEGKIRYTTFSQVLDRVRRDRQLPLIEVTPVNWTHEKPNRALIGKPAPEFSKRDLSGILRSINSYSGRNLILVFWTPSCPHCTRELPRLQQFIDSENGNPNTEILAITGATKDDDVKSFFKSENIRFPVLMDEDRSLFSLYSVSAVPIIYIINRKGIVIEELSGEHPWIGEVLSSILSALDADTILCGHPPRVISGYIESSKKNTARHHGIDTVPQDCEPGEECSARFPVCAAADGQVVFAGRHAGRGLNIIIKHEGNIMTLYSHASRLLVKKGDAVHKGDEIMLAGSTGVSTGVHLHFEAQKDGKSIDPAKALISLKETHADQPLEFDDNDTPLHTYPNPWRKDNKDICFNVGNVTWNPENGPLVVSIDIFDIRGKLVVKVEKSWDNPEEMSGPKSDGKETKDLACWDVRNKSGAPVASGVYIYKLNACVGKTCFDRDRKLSVVR